MGVFDLPLEAKRAWLAAQQELAASAATGRQVYFAALRPVAC